MVKHKNEIPNYIHCSVTGQRFAVRRDVILQRIKEAGSLERLKKTYVCRDARRLMGKEGKSLAETRKLLGCDTEYANMTLVDHAVHDSSSMARVRTAPGDVIDTFWRTEGYRVVEGWDRKPMSQAEVKLTTQHACMFPPNWLEKACHKCPIFADCTLLTKGVYRR